MRLSFCLASDSLIWESAREQERKESVKSQAKGSGIVSGTWKSRLTQGQAHSKQRSQQQSPTVPHGEPTSIHSQDVRVTLLLIPLGFAVNTKRGIDPISILFHVLSRDWALGVSQKPEWNWKWQRNNFLCRKSGAPSAAASPSPGEQMQPLWALNCSWEWGQLGVCRFEANSVSCLVALEGSHWSGLRFNMWPWNSIRSPDHLITDLGTLVSLILNFWV